MSENTNIALTVDEWARIVIERWERKMSQLKIYHSGKLLNSLTHYINTQANGDPDKIVFAFEYYGKFVDMGVGRGMPHGSKEELGGNFYEKRNELGQLLSYKRVAKPWYSKVFWSQFLKLRDILTEKYALKGQMTIITEIEEYNTGNLLGKSNLNIGKNSSAKREKRSSDSYSVENYKRVRMK